MGVFDECTRRWGGEGIQSSLLHGDTMVRYSLFIDWTSGMTSWRHVIVEYSFGIMDMCLVWKWRFRRRPTYQYVIAALFQYGGAATISGGDSISRLSSPSFPIRCLQYDSCVGFQLAPRMQLGLKRLVVVIHHDETMSHFNPRNVHSSHDSDMWLYSCLATYVATYVSYWWSKCCGLFQAWKSSNWPAAERSCRSTRWSWRVPILPFPWRWHIQDIWGR